MSVDPFAGKYTNLSPYVFAHNSPINRRDIDGRQDPTEEEKRRAENEKLKEQSKKNDERARQALLQALDIRVTTGLQLSGTIQIGPLKGVAELKILNSETTVNLNGDGQTKLTDASGVKIETGPLAIGMHSSESTVIDFKGKVTAERDLTLGFSLNGKDLKELSSVGYECGIPGIGSGVSVNLSKVLEAGLLEGVSLFQTGLAQYNDFVLNMEGK